MGTAPSRLDEVQPPADWQSSSNDVGFRLISPTSDISDPSCRIQQQHQQQRINSAMQSSHLTPTLDRRRNSKVVARNLPPRSRPVPTPSSFYFPTRESEDKEDRRGVQSKAQKAKRRAEEDARRRLSKTKETIQKRALQAKQCLAACVEEPMYQIEKIKERIVEGTTEKRDNLENQDPKDLDLNYNRLSTDTTRSVNAAIAKGDKRKKRNNKKWEPLVAEISEAGPKDVESYDDPQGHLLNLRDADPFEPVLRESHITMVTSDQAGNAGGKGGSTPLDPMFTMDIAMHHEETYFQRLSAASQYGASPAFVTSSRANTHPPQLPTPQRVHYISSPESFDVNTGKDVTEGEIDSPVASLFMNEIFDTSDLLDTKSQATNVGCPRDDAPLRSASTQAANSNATKLDTQITAGLQAPHNVITLPTSNTSGTVLLDPTEAEDWLTMGGIVSPRASTLAPEKNVKANHHNVAETHTKAVEKQEKNKLTMGGIVSPRASTLAGEEVKAHKNETETHVKDVEKQGKNTPFADEDLQGARVLVSTKLRKDSPFRPLVRGFASKPFPSIKSLIRMSPSADYHAKENNKLKKGSKPLSTRSFDDYGAVHKLWLLPNVLAAAKTISGLDQTSGNGSPAVTRWKSKSAPSPADDSVHSSMIMSPGPLLTDQVLCNAAFLFSPSYVGGLERLQPSRRSESIGARRSPLANLISTHGSRSHLSDFSRHSYPPVTIPLSESQQQLLLRNSHGSHSSREGSSESTRRVRFSMAEESIGNSTTTMNEPNCATAKDVLVPALKQRPSDASSVVFTGYNMPSKSYDLEVSSESEADEFSIIPSVPDALLSPRHSYVLPERNFDLQTTVESEAPLQQPSTPVAISEHGSPFDVSDKGTPDAPSRDEDENPSEAVDEETLENHSSTSHELAPSMYWSYRSANGERSAVTPMLGKKSAKLATNSPFLRFKAAKNRFSNPPSKTTPVRKAQKKFSEVSAGGIVSSRVTEIDGRLKCTRPRSIKKFAAKRGSVATAPRMEMVEKPVFRNPVIMGFKKTVSSFNESDGTSNRESLIVCLGGADIPKDRRNSGASYLQPDSRGSSSSFPMNETDKSSLMEVYSQLNRAPASSIGSSRYSLVSSSSSNCELHKVSTPSSVGPFTAFDGTPVSPDHSEATDITKPGTLRTPLQRNPDFSASLKMSTTSAGASPEPSPLGSCSTQSGSSGSNSPFGALKLQEEVEESFSNHPIAQSRLFERPEPTSSDADASEDLFDMLMNADGRELLASPMVSDSSDSKDDSELDPFQSELSRPSISKSTLKSEGRHNRLQSDPSQLSLQSNATSTASSRFFSTLRRDDSLRSLAESRKSNASGSTTLSAIIQKENLSYLPFRHEAPVKPSELRHHAAPGALNLSPLQRTPMQASKWRTLAAAAHEKRKNQNQMKHGSGRGVLSERKSINQNKA